MKRFVFAAVLMGWRLLIALVLLLNLRLYAPTPLAPSLDEAPPDLVLQLNANRNAIDAGAPQQMQNLFPEGFYFCYVFHGLTWVELAMRDANFTEQAISEATWCLNHLDSPDGKAAFSPNLPPDHGMFYSAWKCHLLAGIVKLQQGKDNDNANRLRDECDAVADALTTTRTPFLPSYPGQSWPCDSVPAIHALVTYDRVFDDSRYQAVVQKWLQDAGQRLDPGTGLIPHTAGLPTGQQVSDARATSQVIVLRYLPDIDPDFAKEQYEIYRDRFCVDFLGAPCVLEYPTGVWGSGDVDSGPLIFRRSISGTVVAMGIAQIYGDQEYADAVAICGEAVGLPWTSGNQKSYAGGVMPIGSIIVAYAHVARPWFATTQHQPKMTLNLSTLWRWKIHALSLLALVPEVVRWFRRRRLAKNQLATAAA